jgi:extracellular factor (EF) 3-hydroxypalmitic acid methyl ester biosynthesis protein
LRSSIINSTLFLDSVATKLSEGEDVAETMTILFSELHDVRRHLSSASWKQFASVDCLQHPLTELLHQDPLTCRAFTKPRGYAGDAEMLDYLYAVEDGYTLPALKRGSELGRSINRTIIHLDAAKAVRARRWIIIKQLNELAARTPGAHVLSLACGHLREAKRCSALREGLLGRFMAVDQDKESLDVVQREVGQLGVETVAASVRDILKGHVAPGRFDYVYTAGLYDYLPDAVAQRLTELLFKMLNPGGRLLLANFLPTTRSAAFMEAYMDWWLIYRSEPELLHLANTLPEKQIEMLRLFREDNNNVVFLEVERKG